MRKIFVLIIILIFSLNVFACQNADKYRTEDKYNPKKDYFDYSVVLAEFPKDYYYTTVKINKSKERILIITDKVNADKTANYGLFYYFGENGFVYPLGYLKSTKPFMLQVWGLLFICLSTSEYCNPVANHISITSLRKGFGTILVDQWLRICLPM